MEKMAECSRRIFPEIMVTLEKLDKRVVLSIRDNGEGMSPEVKRKLFDSFSQQNRWGRGQALVWQSFVIL